MNTYILDIINNLNKSLIWLKRKQNPVLSLFFMRKIWGVGKEEVITSFVIAGIIISESVFGAIIPQNKKEISDLDSNLTLATIQGNSLVASSNPSEPTPIKKLNVVITAYSSTPEQTDADPFITASGNMVKDGIVANNLLPFGTKIRIPEIYGDKIFVVEDRMHWRKSGYQVDIWFPSYWQAKNFGAKRTYVEILES